MTIRESLAARRPELYARLQVVESKAKQLLEYSQGGAHISYTAHGFSHISAVEENYDWLLSEDDIAGFNPVEIFCLLSATFFHDALMIPTHLGDESSARRDHATRASEFLTKNRDIIGLSLHEANTISHVIRGHAVYDLSELPENMAIGPSLVDIHKLAACLSLSDICHADSSRVPEIVVRHLEMDEESAYHWRRHLQISGITRKGTRLIMSALCFSEEGKKSVEDYLGEIENQLSRIRPFFESKLQPISSVDLQLQQLKSQMDITMRFQANTRAILDILIEGVYQRQDVFLRELVQNGLDACHLRLAKLMRRSEAFQPRIVVTLLLNHGALKAVRVDDNGIGMDVGDIQETVLWIGNSASKRLDIRKLLSETTQKNLIATFGIGLLSCFKSSHNLIVRSAKEGRNPVEVQISSITDEIRPTEPSDQSSGSTFIVELKEEVAIELDLKKAAQHYFRMTQTPIELMQLEWGETTASYSRDDIFRIATTEAAQIRSSIPDGVKPALVLQNIKGDDFLGWLWINKQSIDNITSSEGSLDILNEGVYVCTEKSSEWLPQHLNLCTGVLNFSAGAIDLPVSRDKVVSNKKASQKRAEVASKSIAVIVKLTETTHLLNETSEQAALTISLCFQRADRDNRNRIIRHLDSFHVKYFQRDRRTPLLQVRSLKRTKIFVEYSQGRWVSDLALMDGKQLFHKAEDLTHLQAALLRQNGEIVLSAARIDPADLRILEADIIKDYLQFHGIEVVDLAEQTGAVIGMLRSKPLPKMVRRIISNDVKFVEVEGLPNKRAWKVGGETWINVANPQMGAVYNLLQKENIPPDYVELAKILVDLLSHNFEDSLNGLAKLLIALRPGRTI